MALPIIPSVEEIKNRIVSDVEGKINQFIPAFPISFVKILAKALSGIIFLQYQAIIWVYKQIFPDSADDASLALLGTIVGIFRVKSVNAIILCDVPGTGPQVSQGTLFTGDNGIVYRVETTTAIVAGNAPDTPLRALTSGEIGNLINGEPLEVSQVTPGLSGAATVTSTQTPGANQESLENFSARVSLRYRIRYITGSIGAYALNGLETPNFIWIGPYEDITIPNRINIYGKVDNQPDGIPTNAQLEQLLFFITYDPGTGKEWRRGTNDDLVVAPIEVREFDIEIFINSSNTEINEAVTAAVKKYISALAPFITGITTTRNDTLTKTAAAAAANTAANNEGALVTDVILTDVVLDQIETKYAFFGKEHGKFRNVTFVVVA